MAAFLSTVKRRGVRATRSLARALGVRTVRQVVNGLPLRVPIDAVKGVPNPFRTYRVEHESPLQAELVAHLRPGGVVFDVGAHLGEFAFPAANAVGVGGRVFAFEANPTTARQLGEIARLNGYAQVEVVEGAVGREEGTVSFSARGNSADSGVTTARKAGGSFVEQVEVPVRPLDAFVAARGVAPDLVKVDVEGFEVEVLAGAARTLRDHAPVVCVEVHPRDLRQFGLDPAEVTRRLEALGYANRTPAYARVPDQHDRPFNLIFVKVAP
jgi:FkbM family methyltransferase